MVVGWVVVDWAPDMVNMQMLRVHSLWQCDTKSLASISTIVIELLGYQ